MLPAFPNVDRNKLSDWASVVLDITTLSFALSLSNRRMNSLYQDFPIVSATVVTSCCRDSELLTRELVAIRASLHFVKRDRSWPRTSLQHRAVLIYSDIAQQSPLGIEFAANNFISLYLSIYLFIHLFYSIPFILLVFRRPSDITAATISLRCIVRPISVSISAKVWQSSGSNKGTGNSRIGQAQKALRTGIESCSIMDLCEPCHWSKFPLIHDDWLCVSLYVHIS